MIYQFVFSNDEGYDCGGKSFQKMKFSTQTPGTKLLYDDYGRNVVKGKIFFELTIKVDTFKTETERKATKVFDYLGDVGGFAAAFQGILAVIGAFFSSQFLAGSIAENLYVERKSFKEIRSQTKKMLNDKKSSEKY